MCLNFQLVPMFERPNGKKFLCFNPVFSNYFNYAKDYNSLKELSSNFKKDFIVLARLKKFHFDYDSKFIKAVPVPCGKCPECLNSRAKQIMFRILKEAESYSYKDCYFVTLTYDDDNLPLDFSLVKDEISKFNKKLKTYLKRKGLDSSFRFYGVGEYGSSSGRPHYHVIYFGLPLNDLTFYKSNENGDLLYNSKLLSDVWLKGFVVVGQLEPGSAAYVARYTEKKSLLTSEEKLQFKEAGFVPEFSVQSMRPGIGYYAIDSLVENFGNSVYNFNIKGTNFKLPRYYLDKFKNFSLVDEKALSLYEKFNFEQFYSSLSSKVFNFGDELHVINKNKILDILKQKKRKVL